jgi:hypothetical protein
MLMAKSRPASLRTLQRYAWPSVEAVAALSAAHAPVARRRGARAPPQICFCGGHHPRVQAL